MQLDLNREHVAEADALDGVEGWVRADICDPPADWRHGFDAVVAYGGVLSYVFDDAPVAAAHCFDALADGGVFVGSVMSLAGNARINIDTILELARNGHLNAMDELMRAGDQRAIGAIGGARFQHFSLQRLRAVLASAGGHLVEASASNWLTADSSALLTAAEANPALWDWLINVEERSCRQPGAVEGGPHMLFAARR